MSSQDRRSAGRRRAWGRGPIILKFDSLERRDLLSGAGAALPDLVGSSFSTTQNADWNQQITASGVITNQGQGAVTVPFNVGIYASPNSAIGHRAVLLGEVTISGGLAPGQSTPFTTTVKLPNSPLPGMSANGVVHINIKVDPERVIHESNPLNQSGIGLGHDVAAIQITPQQPARLDTTSLGIYPTAPEWGSTVTVTAQISNTSYGNAPATRAQVVLTPAGVTPGTGSDITIGSISVPAIAAWQTTNVEGTITLPVTPPVLLTGDSQFNLSVMPDADYITNDVYPHTVTGIQGTDIVPANITVPPGTTPPALGALPDLAAGAVTTSANTLYWGHNFQVQAAVQNLGTSDPGPFRVRFILVGASGNTSNGIFLGDTIVQSAAPGSSQVVTQTLALPYRLPAGITLSSLGTGHIAMIVDPENVLNETFKNNNTSTSGPVTLRLLGTDGTSFVPNLPPPAQLLPVYAPPGVSPRSQTVDVAGKKLFRKAPPRHNSLIHNLSVFPSRVNNLIKKYI